MPVDADGASSLFMATIIQMTPTHQKSAAKRICTLRRLLVS